MDDAVNERLGKSDMESLSLTMTMPPIHHEYVQERFTRSTRIRIAIAVILLVCLLLVVLDSFTTKRVESASISFFEWVEANPFRVLFVPGSILTIGTGFAFGTAFGTFMGVILASIAVFFGAFIGSVASFLLGRYLFRDCVVQLAASYPIFQAVDRALQGNGLKIMILLRLSPLIPYNALDYMSGITAISLWAYSVALVAILPGVIMFTFIGATASSLVDGTKEASESRVVRIFSMVFGITFAIIGVSVASYYSKIELDKMLESDQVSSPLTTQEEMSQSETPLESAGIATGGTITTGNFA
mmetsp:Transcript_24044/g.43582  ORF Transcript_24044/g.43582 Transcript_24044/m.43582 type:complete len:301 (-) Transcript_24044:1481-2383(-)